MTRFIKEVKSRMFVPRRNAKPRRLRAKSRDHFHFPIWTSATAAEISSQGTRHVEAARHECLHMQFV